MDALYLLIPLSALGVLGILGVFAWALHSGQFDDLEQQGAQILEAEEGSVDVRQGRIAPDLKQSAQSPARATTENP
jgi:cbb3-type cytochrome oxidase maturation protein